MSTTAYSQFITTWKTDNSGPSNDDQITIPTRFGETYNYTVDWGDGTNDTGIIGNTTHTYAAVGTYTVTITGVFPQIFFNDLGDKDKILTIEQWGSNPWISMFRAFYGCSNLTIAAAAGAPDLSGVTDMSSMFRSASVMNSDLSGWNVSTITNMSSVFRNADLFNQPLIWDVTSVTDMSYMFFFAQSFNQDIGAWEVGSVTNMANMFLAATVFNGDITTWDVSSVTNMSGMFNGAQDFNQNISIWIVSSLGGMSAMFNGASSFNQDISGWNISGVTSLSSLFANASAFDQDLNPWNVYFPGISNMRSMFNGATSFNQDVSGWDVSNVASMESMFANTTFNPDISGWSVNNVSDFSGMFEDNTAFNQNISGWVVSSATDMRSMFSGASAFDQNLGGWDVSNVTLFFNMLDNSGLSVENYDNLLIGWASQTLSLNENLGAVGLFYCSGEVARNSIILTFGWTIDDAGFGCYAVFDGIDTTGPEIVDAQVEPVDFGSTDISTPKIHSITIENKLAVPLTNFNVIISGTAFTVTSPALPTIINIGSTQTIDIQLSSASGGSFAETVTITLGESSALFKFPITGEVTLVPEPEMAVFEGNLTSGAVILDGDLTGYEIGLELRGTDAARQIIIENKGSATLNISSFAISGSAFSLSPSAPAAVLVDGTLIITITLDGTVAGAFSETLTITNNDSDENPYDFVITGIIEGPDIAVFNGPDRFSYPEIFDGQGTPMAFGTTLEGNDIVKQLTLANFGKVDLAISNISISGSAFSIAASPPIVIDAEFDGIVSTETYSITLDGSAIGVFNETITITSDDDDESSFSFTLSGEIRDPAAIVPLIYWTESMGNQINRSELDGSLFEQLFTAADTPTGIAVDAVNSEIYWSTNLGDIWKGTIDASGIISPTKFIDDGTDLSRRVGGIALDVADGKIYWASTYDNSIKVAELFAADPSTTILVLANVENPESVDVSPGDKIYYVYNDYAATMADPSFAVLGSADIDGSNAQTLVATGYAYFDINNISDVKVDVINNKIFWSSFGDSFAQEIFQADLAPFGNITSYMITSGDPLALELDRANSKIYWLESRVPSFEPTQINRANYDGTGAEVIQSGLPNLTFPRFLALDFSQPVVGCASPPTASADIDQTICENGTVSLNGSIGGAATTILWTTAGDGTFDVATSLIAVYTPGVNDITAGNVTLTITTDDPDGSGPCVAATDDVVITINQAATTNAGADQTICEGDAATLSAAIGGAATSTTWTTAGDGTFDDATSLTAVYTPGANDITAGNVTLTITTDDPDAAGPCVASTDDIVIAIDLAHTVNAGLDQSVCLTDPVNITGVLGGSAATAVWSTSGDGVFADVNLLTTVYTPGVADNTAATVTISLTTLAGAACIAVTDDLVVSIGQPITVVDQSASLDVAATVTIDVTNGATINVGDVLLTTLVSMPAKGTATINANGNIDYTAAAGTVGTDSFEFQVCNQCNQCSTAFANITINNAAPVVVIPPASIPFGQDVVIDLLAGISDVNDNIDPASLVIISQPISGATATIDANGVLTIDYTGVTFAGPDELTIEICDFDGLCTEQVINIDVEPPGVTIYNALSPNGDGKHDYLEIQNAELFPGNQVKILNRWGDIVFDIRAYDNSTNRFEGKANNGSSGDLPPGTYFYTISLGDGSADMTGFFTLRR